jgi:anti-sigma regulatory factor (Ser/Thr protein kinase)
MNTLAAFDPGGAMIAEHCHFRLPSLPEAVPAAVDFLVGRATRCGAAPPGRASGLQLALLEALTNSVVHGNLGVSSALKEQGDNAFAAALAARAADPAYASRVVDVQARHDREGARWVFTDQGEGFDVDRAMHRLAHETPDALAPSGRGLFMISAFVDEMRYEDSGRRLVLGVHRGRERRSAPRTALAQGVRVCPIDESGQARPESGWEAVAHDLSAQGIGLRQQGLAGVSRVLITIPTAGAPIQLPAEVRRWQQLGDGVEVGCRFEASAPALDALARLADR